MAAAEGVARRRAGEMWELAAGPVRAGGAQIMTIDQLEKNDLSRFERLIEAAMREAAGEAPKWPLSLP